MQYTQLRQDKIIPSGPLKLSLIQFLLKDDLVAVLIYCITAPRRRDVIIKAFSDTILQSLADESS